MTEQISDPEHAGQEHSNAYDRIIKYTGLFGGVQGIVTLITIVRTKLVSMLLGPNGFGINESFNRTLNLVKSTTDLGIPFSAVKSVSECREGNTMQLEESVLITRTWALLTAMAGMLLCILLAPAFSYWAFDGDRGYTLSFLLLSPMAACSAVTGGETAIMKGSGMLGQLAKSQLLMVLATLCISVPVLWKMGLPGIAPSLVLVSFASMVITCCFSFRRFPYRVRLFSKATLTKGFGMIRLGVFFTITSFFGSGAFTIIANYLMNNGSAEETGIYSAGYLLISYLGMFVFSAMESDYFPSISAVNQEREKINRLANSQTEVALLLMAPIVVGFILFSGVIVSLLLTPKFAEAVPMARLAAVGLMFKCLTQPLSYISLAKGDSRTFMIQEVLYDVVFVATVLGLFRLGGVVLTGAALTAAALADTVIVYSITHARYGITISRRAIVVLALQMLLILATLAAVSYIPGMLKWAAGVVLLAISSYYSLHHLKKHTSFIRTVEEKVKRKLRS